VSRPVAARVVVAGQLARDVVLLVDEMPDAGSAADVRLRREMLGGKGANQAVALAQLGVTVTLVAVAGDDAVGDQLIAQASRDGIDTSHVVRRAGESSALIVEALDQAGQWRYLQHIPDGVLLTEADVESAAPTIRTADAVVVQLQQPGPAAVAVARLAREANALVLLDGVPDERHRSALLAAADVVRADAHETKLLTGTGQPDQLLAAAREILAPAGSTEHGPSLLALGVESGNLFVWHHPHWGAGHILLPLTEENVVDTTGAGDAMVAALATALLRGDLPPVAARYAVAAAGVAVSSPGGRPHLTEDALRDRLAKVPAG